MKKAPGLGFFIVRFLAFTVGLGLSFPILTGQTAGLNATGGMIARQGTPVLSSISPAQTSKGTVPSKIKIKGSGFVSGSVVKFNSTQITAAKFKDASKIVIKGAPTELFQSDTTYKVTVTNPDGKVSNSIDFVVGAGSSTATATEIEIVDPETLVVNTPNDLTANTISLTVKVLDQNGSPIPNPPITYRSLNPEIASISPTGVITGIAEGAATIELTSGNVVKQVSCAVNQVTTTVSGIFGEADLEIQGSTRRNFASDFQKHTIRAGQTGQALSGFVGKADNPGNNDGDAAGVLLNGPLGLAVGQALYLADVNNQAIRRLDPQTGKTQTLITLADVTRTAGVTNWGPRDISVDSNEDLYITDAVNHVIWQADINNTPVKLKVLAGTPGQPGSKDGTGTAAQFTTPQRIDLEGNVLSVTEDSSLVRQIALPGGEVKSISSTSGRNDRPSRSNRQFLQRPKAIASDSAGNLYVVDDRRVRVLSITRDRVSIGDLAPPGTFRNPVAVAVLEDGVFVLDAELGSIVRVKIGVPSITSISPNPVQSGQVTELIVKGTNLSEPTFITIGRNPFVLARVVSATELRVTVPPIPYGGEFPLIIHTRGGEAIATLKVIGDPPPATVDLSSFPASRTINAGQSAFYTIGLRTSDDVGPVTLTVDGLPAGADAQIAPNPTSMNESLMRVTTSSRIVPGTYVLTITGKGANAGSGSTTVALNIETVTTQSVTLTANPTSQTVVRGVAAVYRIAINRINFPDSVELKAALVNGTVTGLNLQLAPQQTTLDSAILTAVAVPGVPSGTYTIRITGTASGITIQPIDVTLVVN
ncbi:MAG TPA: IPT/TIG domain-containing protein [Acidobacteriota bacterium]|nr:IPT/TIG domain-containing protein [Acidobacteriota bacterium]